ncbi:MAG: histidine phosphatase family protein [Pseudomonadota bacterium]
MRILMLLRHGKSDWSSPTERDFDRPLAERGRKAIKRMAAWMLAQDCLPDYILSSPAARAKETALRLCKKAGLDEAMIHFDERLYLADLAQLLQMLGECPAQAGRIMLVGHNPGLEDLVRFLCGPELPLSSTGKLLPTTALAQIRLPDDWRGLAERSGRLLAITRPEALSED